MFAVKGWSITAPLATQIESKPAAPPATPDDATPSKKRKRDKEANVTADNVGDLYARHIEGNKNAGKKPRGQGKDISEVLAPAADIAEGGAPTPKKKRTRRGKRTNKKPEDGAGAANGDDSEQLGQDTAKKTVKPSNDATKKIEKPISNGADDSKPAKKQKKEKKAKGDGKPVEGSASSDASTKATTGSVVKAAQPSPAAPVPKLTSLQSSMRQKLASARFRHLNETLYTTPSATALTKFTEDPSMFEEYHTGFRQQVAVWPENPVDSYLAEIRIRGVPPVKKAKDNDVKLLPRTKGICTIADLGCGDAKIAETLDANAEGEKKLRLKIHSFDLYSPSPFVTKADISSLPMKDGQADVSIFCLALMGTNWPAFIEEAWRILRPKGELWIAEIKSRFGRIPPPSKTDKTVGKGGSQNRGLNGRVVDHSVGKRRRTEEDDTVLVDPTDPTGTALNPSKETDVRDFISVLRRRGFILDGDEKTAIDLSNRMFVKMRFVKVTREEAMRKDKNADEDKKKKLGKYGRKFIDEGEEDGGVDPEAEAKVLKPCVYKLR